MLNKYIKCNFKGQRCGTTTILDIRRQKVFCFRSTEAVVTRTGLNVTTYVRSLSCLEMTGELWE